MEQWKNRGLFAKTLYSLNGLYKAFVTEKAIRHECVGVALALALAVTKGCPPREIFLVLFASAFPIVAELINTAIERMIDTHCGPTYREEVRIQKDILSGAVFMSLIIGYGFCLVIIFM
ncbi:MAG: diacylglycerol kinase [Cloacibacillus sp.]